MTSDGRCRAATGSPSPRPHCGPSASPGVPERLGHASLWPLGRSSAEHTARRSRTRAPSAFTCIVMTFDSSPGSNRSSASVLLAASASSMPISAASALTLATGSRAKQNQHTQPAPATTSSRRELPRAPGPGLRPGPGPTTDVGRGVGGGSPWGAPPWRRCLSRRPGPATGRSGRPAPPSRSFASTSAASPPVSAPSRPAPPRCRAVPCRAVPCRAVKSRRPPPPAAILPPARSGRSRRSRSGSRSRSRSRSRRWRPARREAEARPVPASDRPRLAAAALRSGAAPREPTGAATLQRATERWSESFIAPGREADAGRRRAAGGAAGSQCWRGC